MPRWVSGQYSIAAGEIADEVTFRRDLGLYYRAVRRCRNALPILSGGVEKRPGLRRLFELAADARLIPFVFDENERMLLAFLPDGSWEVRDENGVLRSTGSGGPWTGLSDLHWAINGDVMILCAAGMRTQRMRRTSLYGWTREDFSFDEVETLNGRRRASPHAFFESRTVALKPNGTTGNITITATGNLFTADWVGTRLRLKGREVEITGYTSQTLVNAVVHETLVDTNQTFDWTREAIGDLAGWPATVVWHAGRLWFGGLPALPYRVCASAAGDFFNFNEDEEGDSAAFSVDVTGESVQRVVRMIGMQDLYVVTLDRTYVVTRNQDGAFTPQSAVALRVMDVGSRADMPAATHDGAVTIVGSNGRSVLQAQVDESGQPVRTDLALLGRHLLSSPVDMAEIVIPDRAERLLGVVEADGRLVVFLSYRAEGMLFSGQWETSGSFERILRWGETTLFVVRRGANRVVEILDPAARYDSSVFNAAKDASSVNLSWLNGKAVEARLGESAVWSGAAQTVTYPQTPWEEIGLPYRMIIESLPVDGVAFQAPLTHTVKRIHTLLARLSGAVGVIVDGRPRRLIRSPGLGHPPPDDPTSGLFRFAVFGAGREQTVTMEFTDPARTRILGFVLEAEV